MIWRCVRVCCNALLSRPHALALGTGRRCLTSAAAAAPVRSSLSILTQRDDLVKDSFICVKGNVRTVRRSKRTAFAEISDGSTTRPLQAVFSDPQQASGLTTGSAVELTGTLVRSLHAEQKYELQVEDVKVVGEADAKTYPMQKKYHSPEFLRSMPHMRMRTQFNSFLSRFRSEIIYNLTEWFHDGEDPFFQVQPPMITSSDCEGAGEVFTVKSSTPSTPHFFRDPKYLTVSTQLHLEAYAAELGRVWTLSPTFRAEQSDTPRHLAEFYMLEVEMSHVKTLAELTRFVESMLRDLVTTTKSWLPELHVARSKLEPPTDAVERAEGSFVSAQELEDRWSILESNNWPQISYDDAIELLCKKASQDASFFTHAPNWSEGLALEHEKYVAKYVGGGKSPVFVTHYPADIKPFYMLPSNVDEHDLSAKTVACFDLLLPDLAEVAGGSLREYRLPNLIACMREKGLLKQKPIVPSEEEVSTYPFLRRDQSLGSLQWYADLRRWGTTPHGGFGLGFDRLLAYLVGVSSLRDAVAFPRYYGRCEC